MWLEVLEGQKHGVHACSELPEAAFSVGAWARGEQVVLEVAGQLAWPGEGRPG